MALLLTLGPIALILILLNLSNIKAFFRRRKQPKKVECTNLTTTNIAMEILHTQITQPTIT